MLASMLQKTAFLFYNQETYFPNLESGQFYAKLFGRIWYFKQSPLEEKITAEGAIEQLFQENKNDNCNDDFLNLFGNLFQVKRPWLNKGTFKVKKLFKRVEFEEHCYNQRFRLGYKKINGSPYVIRNAEPFALKHNMATYSFPKAMLGTRAQLVNNSLEFSPLMVLNKYTHPGLPHQDKEMQTLCIGDIKYAEIKEMYAGRPLKYLLHLFSIGESALKAKYFKRDCYQPLERSGLYNVAA